MDAEGRRCEARTLLELDHGNPRALGGSDEAINLSVKCRRHNGLEAERAFGRAHIDRKKSESGYPRQRVHDNSIALLALSKMGFKERDARRALEAISNDWMYGVPPMEDVLRDALRLLT